MVMKPCETGEAISDRGDPTLGASFVLASASVARLALLKKIHMVPDICFPVSVDESPRKHERSRMYVERVAGLKMEAAFTEYPDEIILAADTIVSVGRRLMQKPKNRDEARAMLELYSGRRFRVFTSIVMQDWQKRCQRTAWAHLRFKRLSSEEIEWYLQTHPWQNCCGALVIEGVAGSFLTHISGSYSAVLGLPLYEMAHLLTAFSLNDRRTP
jgi:septum formation protein